MSRPSRPAAAPLDRDAGRADELTLTEVAEELGLHYMTVYRYVRTGRLEAARAGTQWRVARGALAGLAAPTSEARQPRSGPTVRATTLAHALKKGDERAAWRLTEDALTGGLDAESVYVDLLGPALRQIGDDWATGRATVAEEHRATVVAHRLIGRLGPRFARRGTSRGTVVIGAPAGDTHALASALVADPLRGRGVSVVDLGANTPANSWAEAIAATPRVRAAGIVVSTPLPNRTIAATIAAIKGAADIPLIVGGVAIRDAKAAARLGADSHTTSTSAAIDRLDEQVPTPRR